MNAAIQFVKEAYAELLKASWLGKKEVRDSTIVVFVIVALVGLYVTSVDGILTFLFNLLLGVR